MSEADEAYSLASFRRQVINSIRSRKSFAPFQRPPRLLRGNGRELLMVIPGPATLLWL
jgi:hypothetical protein